VLSAREEMDVPLTDGGYEIAPWALTDLLLRLRADYGDVPIFITENGAIYDDAPHDPGRVAFLRDHLAAVHDAIEQGAPVRGYFHWSLMDNFEWALGYKPRFGLVHVDYETQERKVKDSGREYARRPQERAVSADLAAAADFVLREARLLDRRRFALRFGDGASEEVLAALEPYQNEDGGFGNALEPDLRGAASQPVPLEHALRILDGIDRFDKRIVARACDWLVTVTTEAGGVPFVLETVTDGPHAPWWEPTGEAYPNPTAGIAGILHKRAFEHEWLTRATEYLWRALERLDGIGQDDAISVLAFLEHVPDRAYAEAVFDRLGERIVNELVELDPSAPGYVKTPLDFAPHPDALARRLFDDETIELHLDALEAKQQPDGGWPITGEPPSVAAVSEWRAVWTLKALDVLDNYGRLEM
jgi:hypothetical protein